MPAKQIVKPAKDFEQPTKPKAYSYVRFSTPDQMKGDSFNRQTRKATEYASAHGLELDTALTFQDLGVSAFRGRNAQTGALRRFLEAVEQGDIPQGSHLLVENLDRISRDQVIAAQSLFLQIIEAGITIVTLTDNKAYSKKTVNDNPTDLIIAILSQIRGHEESVLKAERVASAYESKRQRAAEGDKSKPFTRMLPAWLCVDEGTKQIKVRDRRDAIVRDIYKKAIAGWGQHKIARWLNDRHVPTWGDASQWHRSYVKKILGNPAVIGTFTPHTKRSDSNGKRRRKPLDPIENYFPAVIEREMFDTLALRLTTTAARGRHANRAVRSLFAGVLRCSQCGSTVSRISKGEHVYLACAKAYSRAGTHSYRAIRYGDVEQAFRRLARGIIKDAPRTTDTDLEEQIRQCGLEIDEGEEQVREWVEELRIHKSDAVREELQQAEAELEHYREKLRALIERRETLAPERVERKLQALLEALKRKPFDVAAANLAIRQAIRQIVMDVEQGTLQIYWHHAGANADPQVVPFPRFQRQRSPTRRGKRQRPSLSQTAPATPINS